MEQTFENIYFIIIVTYNLCKEYNNQIEIDAEASMVCLCLQV